MTTALVTGAAGFVGANLVRRLADDGHDVHAVVHPDTDLWRLGDVGGSMTIHPLDLEDRDRVRGLTVELGADWVFHAAAHGAYPSQTDLRRMIATNLIVTANVLEAALDTGFRAFVHTGTSSEYGYKDHAPSEDERLEPNSHYALTKASSTLYCEHMARVHGARICVLRLYSVYGPWEEPTRLMPRLASRGLQGTWPPMANPATARDYVYTDDVVDAYLTAARDPDLEPGAVFNVGTGVQTTLREVADVVRRELPIDSEPRWGAMPDRGWDAAVWVADPSAAAKHLGWTARHDLASGFGAFVAWMRSRPELRRRYEQD